MHCIYVHNGSVFPDSLAAVPAVNYMYLKLAGAKSNSILSHAQGLYLAEIILTIKLYLHFSGTREAKNRMCCNDVYSTTSAQTYYWSRSGYTGK